MDATGKLDHGYTFSCNTSNYSLRGHVVNWHLEEYLALADENGWIPQIDSIRIALGTGYTLKTLLEAIQQGHQLTTLPPAPRPNNGGIQQHDRLQSSDAPTVPEFSLGAMHDYLVRFIVADDQVRLKF